MRSVAKHSYVKGKTGVARISAHVNYLQNRPGQDREEGPRKFFNSNRDGIDGVEVKRELAEQGYSKVVAHKIILSPGMENVDMDAYTREVMLEIGKAKGLDLNWWSVKHENTDHDHAHVVIAGLDRNGRDVNFSKRDYQKIREVGDRHLERNYELERYLERDADRVLSDRSKYFGIDRLMSGISFERTGDREFRNLLREVEEKEKRGKERKPGETEREFKKIDDDLKRSLNASDRPGADFGKGHQQRLREAQGRLSENHGQYTASIEINRLQRELAQNPDRASEIEAHISAIKEIGRDSLDRGSGWKAFDEFCGFNSKNYDRQKDKGEERAQVVSRQNTDETARQVVIDAMQKPLKTDEPERDQDEDMFARGER